MTITQHEGAPVIGPRHAASGSPPKLSSDQLHAAQQHTLDSPRRDYGLLARMLFMLTDLAYGRKRTIVKFVMLEFIARVPYQAWEWVGYWALSRHRRKSALARRVFERIEQTRAEQDNEQWHLLILQDLAQRAGMRQSFLLHRVVPSLIAFVYYHASWLLFLIKPDWSYRLNADFEDHAEHEYMAFVAEHPEYETRSDPGTYAAEYGHYASLADLFRQIGHDERVHKLDSLANMIEPRPGQERARRPRGAATPAPNAAPRVAMQQVELSAGVIDYQDTAGPGPTVVLLHGLVMDSSLWDGVIADLSTDHRCIAPTLPLGAHRHPMPDADLSLPGLARIVEEFLERLDLDDVTLVGNDTGGAVVQLLMRRGCTRVGAVVLASCEAFDNVPPGLTGRTIVRAGKLPPSLFGLFMQQMRLRPLRRLPLAFGWLTKRGDAATMLWLRPVLTQPEIRRDTVRVLRGIAEQRHILSDAADWLRDFTHPALVVWASADRVMPPEHGRRLADLLPDARLVEVDDSHTLIPLDQPATLATHIREFTTGRNHSSASIPQEDRRAAAAVGDAEHHAEPSAPTE